MFGAYNFGSGETFERLLILSKAESQVRITWH